VAAELSSSTVSDIIGLIYDSAVDPTLWPHALAGLRKALDFHNASLLLQSLPTGQPLLNVTEGIGAPWLDAMSLYAEDIVRQWGGPAKILTYPMHQPQVLSWVSDLSAWQDNRYYTEWARPQGIIDVMAIGVARDAASIGSLGLGRHRDAGAITQRETEAVGLFIPHLQRAVAISRLMDIRTVVAGTLERTLDALAAAVLLVDAEQRIVHQNRAAGAMIEAGQPVFSSGGALRLRSAAAGEALAAAVARAASNETGISGSAMGVPLRREEGGSYILNVLPLGRGETRGTLMPAAVAAIFIASDGSAPMATPPTFAELYGLTPAEVAVYDRILNGESVAEIAARLDITASTVKTHIQHLFDKTGARRQSQLILLASSFTLPLER